MSQLDLACEAEISTRHLSFVETGRATPSRDMVMHLAERLDVPVRERNALLVAAGYAPMFAERSLDDPAFAQVRASITQLIEAHKPWPALVIDGHWLLIQANSAVNSLLGGVAPWLLEPPVNVLRLTLHPEGMAPYIDNLGEWRTHLLDGLRHQCAHRPDPVLAQLHDELCAYPGPPPPARIGEVQPIAVPLRLRTPLGLLTLLSTSMVFGTPLDVTLAELAIEVFLSADAATAKLLERASGSDGQEM